MSVFVDAIEGPPGAAAGWSGSDWSTVHRHVSRLQTRIVKGVVHGHRVLHGALPRLEPGAVKVARRVLKGRGGGDVTPLPDVRQAWRVAPMTGAGNRKAKADREVT